MKLLTPSLIVAGMLALASCKNESSTSSTPTTTPTTTTTVPPVNANPTGNMAALNPEHGQPGHRCDIPVGAPLNTPAAGGAAPINANAPSISNPSVPSITAGSGKLNPAHGEPGHRCDIPVGSPL